MAFKSRNSLGLHMYYPYFRGKQFELITLRESVDFFRDGSIIPIIEPVKSNLNGLKKSLEILTENNVKFILIINPKHGDLKNDPTSLDTELLNEILREYEQYSIGYIVDPNSSLIDIRDFLNVYSNKNITLIHCGFPKGKDLKNMIEGRNNIREHIFIDGYSGKLYERQFKGNGVKRILVRDGFQRQRNIDYPTDEHFSDLHATYTDEGMDGFGDFLIVGDEYTETGGPAYAVAIHMTYLDEDEDMRIKHFVSDISKSSTPVDPAGKFFEALQKLIDEINDPDTRVCQTSTCEEFRELHKNGHFPGLGYIKKMSIKHHIELISNFIKS
jgi:hypothetical protein